MDIVRGRDGPLTPSLSFAVQVSVGSRSLNVGADVLVFRVLRSTLSLCSLAVPSAPHQSEGDDDRHDDDQDHEDDQEIVGETHSVIRPGVSGGCDGCGGLDSDEVDGITYIVAIISALTSLEVTLECEGHVRVLSAVDVHLDGSAEVVLQDIGDLVFTGLELNKLDSVHQHEGVADLGHDLSVDVDGSDSLVGSYEDVVDIVLDVGVDLLETCDSDVLSIDSLVLGILPGLELCIVDLGVEVGDGDFVVCRIGGHPEGVLDVVLGGDDALGLGLDGSECGLGGHDCHSCCGVESHSGDGSGADVDDEVLIVGILVESDEDLLGCSGSIFLDGNGTVYDGGAVQCDVSSINDKVSELDTERQTLQEEIVSLTCSKTESKMGQITDHVKKWQDISFEDKQAVVDALIKVIKVANGNIEITWKI